MNRRLHTRPKSLFSSLGLVLIAVWQSPTATVEEIAERTSLAPRYVSILLHDLRVLGFLQRGEDSSFVIRPERELIHPMFKGEPIGKLLGAIEGFLRELPEGDGES